MRIKLKLCVLALALAALLCLGACNQTDSGEFGGGGASAQVSEVSQRTDVFPADTVVGGNDISGKTLAEAVALCSESLKNKLSALSVQVNFEGDTVAINGSELSYTDIIPEYLAKLFQDRTGGTHGLEYTVDTAGIIEKLTPTAQAHTQEAQNSTVDTFDLSTASFTFTEPVDGKKVDLTETAKQVAGLFLSGAGGTVDAQMTTQPAAVTAEQLQNKFTRLSSYETISQNTENGTYNMGEALRRINGLVLQPGEEFSFNGTVGDSTYDGSGFLPANGLMNGVLVPVYGGGICQASSTIYMAALYAGLEITLRECHSTQSTYVPIGLDATVSYNDLDFRFRNQYDFPIYIVGYVDGVTVHTSIYGCQPDDWDEISISSWQSGTEPQPDGVRYLTDNSLAPGESVKKTDGHAGQYAQAQRSFYKNGAEVRTEALSGSYYPALQTTYMVGPGTDTGNLGGSSGGTANPNPPVNNNPPPPAPEPPAPEPPAPEPPAPEPPAPEPPAPEPPAPEPPAPEPPAPEPPAPEPPAPEPPAPEPVPVG